MLITINHPGATSQKNALVSRSLLKECIDFTLGAENGTNLDIGDFAEQPGWEGHWRPITVIPREMPTMTGDEVIPDFKGVVKVGLHRLVALEILMKPGSWWSCQEDS